MSSKRATRSATPQGERNGHGPGLDAERVKDFLDGAPDAQRRYGEAALQAYASYLDEGGVPADERLPFVRSFNRRELTGEQRQSKRTVREIAREGYRPLPPNEQAVVEQVEGMRIREAARQRVREQASRVFELPPAGRTLAHDLTVPAREQQFAVEGLHPAGGNSLLVAQYKTGKTTLLLNLLKALADRQPFLGRFEVAKLDGRVAYWNYELHADMLRRWVRDIGIAHPERVAEPLHLRGHALPFWLPEVEGRAAAWLRRERVRFLLIDPGARAWHGLIDNESDNAQMAAFTGALDSLKERAGIEDCVLAVHMGREQFEEDAERSRGATHLEDWMDAGWYLRKDRTGTRSLRAIGRDVDVSALDLAYDEATRRLHTTGERRDRRDAEGAAHALEALLRLAKAGTYPATTRALRAEIEGAKNDRGQWIEQAVQRGFVKVRHGERGAKLHTLTRRGKQWLNGYREEAA